MYVNDNDNPITEDQTMDELLEELSNHQQPNLEPYLGTLFRSLTEEELRVVSYGLADIVKGLYAKESSAYKNATKKMIRNLTLVYKTTLSDSFLWLEVLNLNKLIDKHFVTSLERKNMFRRWF